MNGNKISGDSSFFIDVMDRISAHEEARELLDKCKLIKVKDVSIYRSHISWFHRIPISTQWIHLYEQGKKETLIYAIGVLLLKYGVKSSARKICVSNKCRL